MQELIERIQTNARRRLVDEMAPDEPLEAFRRFLKDENWRLEQSVRQMDSGRAITSARSEVVDQILKRLGALVQDNPNLNPSKSKFLLIAVGGYGRREMCPSSDVDLLILHDGSFIYRNRPTQFAKAVTERIITTLFDLKFKLGHSVRSIDECVSIGNQDLETKTTYIESRLVYGSPKIFEKYTTTIDKKCVFGAVDEYIEYRLNDQAKRRAKFGDSPLVQTPQIKNGCGGLRDYQNLVWMSYFKYQTLNLRDLAKRGLIRETDVNTLNKAYDFLLRVRYHLHLEDARSADVLDRSHQVSLAKLFGYEDTDTALGIESFMRDYYHHAKQIDHWTRTLERTLAFQPTPKKRPTFKQVISSRSKPKQTQKFDGFEASEGYLLPSSKRLFSEKPRRIMRAFLYLQKRGLELHPDLVHAIHDRLDLVNQNFREDPRVHKTFLEILSHPGSVATPLRAMHDIGVLGRFLPEFGRLRLLVHHEFLHQYTVDEHTLKCIDTLDSIWGADSQPGNRYKGLLKDLAHPYALYLALLLHDAGKASKDGPHEEIGVTIAENVGERLRLPDSDISIIKRVIRWHLLLVKNSQHSDIEDPDVIESVAEKVEDMETLNMLAIHTFCDASGTSPTLWTEFKDVLLWNLYFKTRDYFIDKELILNPESDRSKLKQIVAELLDANTQRDEIDSMFGTMPERYFSIHDAPEIAKHTELIHEFLVNVQSGDSVPLNPIISWENDEDRGFSVLTVCTWNRQGLFANVSGCLTASGLTVLSANVYSRTDGIVLDTYIVADAFSGRNPSQSRRDKFGKLISEALTSELDIDRLILAQRKKMRRTNPVDDLQIETTVSVNGRHELYNIIEITTDDDIGLLYAVSRTICNLDLDIWIARIFTELGAAVDTFFVAQTEGSKIEDRERLEYIRDQLIASIEANRNTPTKP